MKVSLNWWGRAGIFGLGVIVILSIFAPLIAPFEPDMQDLDAILAPMSFTHWFGTDYLGRDIFSRLLYGARLSLGCTFIILGFILLLGVGIGGLCGFIGGKIDALCMRICDVFMSVPTIALSLFLVGVLGAGLENVMIAIVLTHWAWYARIMRSIVFSLKNKDYVVLSYTFGSSIFERFARHFTTPIFIQCAILASMDIGHIMLHIAGLSFLGLGVQPPNAEWGIMLSEAKDYMWDYPMLIIYPGLALFVTVALCNIIGEALRDSYGTSESLDDIPKDIAPLQKVGVKPIRAEKLSLHRALLKDDTHQLLEVDTLVLKRGECRALVGNSGSGKSLSAFALQGFLASNLDKSYIEVRLDGEVINPTQYRAIAFMCIMQSPRTCFNPLLTMEYHFKETSKALHKPYNRAFVKQCLRDSGLDNHVLKCYAFELSGGMLQRVMIALALYTQAPFIIADEPTSDLDKPIAQEILHTLESLLEHKNLGILLITHDLRVVGAYAQYVYVLEKGKIIERTHLNTIEAPISNTLKRLKAIIAKRDANVRD